MRNKLSWGGVLLVLISASFMGCGGPVAEPQFKVSGKITKGGQPLPLDPALAKAQAARVEVRFLRMTDSGSPDYSTTGFAEPDGSFTVVNVPKGKYRIAVVHIDGDSPDDKLGGKFDERNSPITREISGDTENLTIDLDKPEAT